MNNVGLPSPLPLLQLGLALLHDPAGAFALGQFIGLSEPEVLDSLASLERDGLLSREEAAGTGGQPVQSDQPEQAGRPAAATWRVPDEAARQKLGAQAASRVDPASEDKLSQGLSLLWAGQTLPGCRPLIRVLRELIYAGHIPGALVCLDILLQALEKWGERPEQPQREDEQYIYLAKIVLGVVLFLTKRRRRAKAVLGILSRLAAGLGDRRNILRVKLMQVCLHHSIGGVLEEDPVAIMEQIREEAHELGDRDILTEAAHGFGMQHYIRGEYAEAIENYRYYQGSLEGFDRFYGNTAVNTVTLSACNLGRFGNALGAVLGGLQTHQERGSKYAVKWARLLAADVLLRVGRPDQALAMMNEKATACDPEAESRLAVGRARNLAFYHFQKGERALAHELLTECVGIAARYKIYQPLAWLPDIYEMLWEFQEAGLPDIPGHALEDLLVAALAGHNLHIQGIALRLRGRQLNKQRRFQAALPLLEDSLAKLGQCQTPLGLARSELVLAESLAGLGRREEAGKLRLEACAVLDEHLQYDRRRCSAPGELPKPARDRNAGLNCVRQCREALADRPERGPHLQEVIDRLRDELQLERVAVFSAEPDYSLACLAARDFSPAERSKKLPARYGRRILDCLHGGRTLRWRSRYGAVLCLPLRVSPKQNCVFLAHCTYLVDSIMEPDQEYFEPVIDYLTDEIRTARLVEQSVQARQLEEESRSRLASERSVNDSGLYYGPAMQETLALADKAAPTSAPILILGETGAGKEELARRLHRNSGRSGPFVVVHPASISEQLFESELFGHEKGAFTGAYQQKVGLLELADKGTLFIDEIGEISLSMQVKLLRVLQDNNFLRVGGTTLLNSDFRLISATHQNLAEKIRDGSFREDFYYRIAVMPLRMPPLRERPEDIRHLARLFQAYFSAKYKKPLPPLTPAELDQLCSLPWPGNVRELRSYVERGVILYDPAQGGFIQEMPAIPAPRPGTGLGGAASAGPGSSGQEFTCSDLPSLDELQKRYLEHVLRLTHGKVGGAGGAQQVLGVKLSTLYKKMKKYGLDKASLIYGQRD